MSDQDTQSVAALKEIALEGLKEQKRSRRWGIFFKFAFFAYFVVFLVIMGSKGVSNSVMTDADEITAVVDLSGVIQADGEIDADRVIPSLREAFEHEKTKAVVLRINSPGGSPVQSGYINDEIRRLKKKHEMPVYAVVSDVCASGGYYIAVAADYIYADKASIVGSIGVRMDSFGVEEAMKKLGVERRLITAGEHKALLDPFSPIAEDEKKHLEDMLAMTHRQFIDVVKEGRGDRLKDNPDIFSGLFWTGEKAIELGLVDGLGSTSYVARDVIKAEEIVNFTTEKDVLQKLSDKLAASMSTALTNVLSSKLQLQ